MISLRLCLNFYYAKLKILITNFAFVIRRFIICSVKEGIASTIPSHKTTLIIDLPPDYTRIKNPVKRRKHYSLKTLNILSRF